MRVLFTTTGSAGHLGPLVPFADAVRRSGGEVLVATRGSSAHRVRAAHLDVWPFPDAEPAARAAAMAALVDLPPEAANARMVSEVFAGMDTRAALPGVLDACAQWQPDVVVSEASEFAGRIAADHLGLAHVTVSITQFALEHRLEAVIEDGLERLRAEHGLSGANGAGSARFTLMPPLLEHPEIPGPAGVERFREPDGTPPRPLPDWWRGAAEPLVYVTFGSVAPQRDDVFPGLYAAAIDALAPLPVRVLVTVGRDRSPLELAARSPRVRVEQWVTQARVMPHARVVVSHGGSGTVRAGLTAGLPQVVLPLFADQFDNAARIHALGAGIALDDVSALGDAVRAVLADTRYAERAAAVAADIRQLPPVDRAASRLRELAGARPVAGRPSA